MIEGFAALFCSINEDLQRFLDAFLPDVLRKPSRTEAALHRHILDELPRGYGAIGRCANLGATANGGICFSNHAVSIAEQLELLFDFGVVRQHVGYAVSHRVAATAPLADELASVQPDCTPVHWTDQQTNQPRLQRGRVVIGSSAVSAPSTGPQLARCHSRPWRTCPAACGPDCVVDRLTRRARRLPITRITVVPARNGIGPNPKLNFVRNAS